MTNPHPAPDLPLAAEIEAALAWWRAAGVDCDFGDDATAWLSDTADPGPGEPGAAAGAERALALSARPSGTTGQAPEAVPNVLGESPPMTLSAFREFWLTAPGLDPVGPRGRVPPRGGASPELMVLVSDPEQGDDARLLSGPQGALLTNILAAIGLAPEQVYIASALPRHTPMADLAAAAQAGLGQVLAHHVALVAPKRVVAFGGNILPLLQHGAPDNENSLREINQKGSSNFVLVSEGLDAMLAMPRIKTRFWRRWNEWSVQS